MPLPVLVLLHGFCEDKSLWDHIIPSLDYEGEIIAINLPGFEKSNANKKTGTLIEVAKFIKTKLSNRGITQCMCIGHSLGGYVALALKSEYPKFISAIGLIHSTAFADSTEKKKTRNKFLKFLDNNLATNFLASFASSLFTESNAKRLKADVTKVINMSKGLEGVVIKNYVKAMKDRPDTRHILYKEFAPLFIAGVQDSSVSLKDSIAQIDGISNKHNCYLLPDVAHMGMYESPSTIVKAINKFCNHNRVANH